jgi:hypothetical protein
MRLLDLDPKWLVLDGRRVGFTFISPTNPQYRQSCFTEQLPRAEQWRLFEEAHGEEFQVQGCRSDFAWTVVDGIAAADFATISVTPSLDGSAGGLWHGYITRGEIVGGI